MAAFLGARPARRRLWLALGAGASVVAAPERRARWRSATATVAAAYLLNTAVKLIVRRPRPLLAWICRS